MRAIARVFAVLALALALAPALALAAKPATLRFQGYAYDRASGRYLYTEVHEQKVVGERWIGGTITYYAPDGSLMGRKTLDFSSDPFVPVYQLELTAGGHFTEAITAIDATRIVMSRQNYDDTEPATVTIKRPALVVADSGFHPFLREHFAELLGGGTVTFRFAVAGSLDLFRFRAKRIEDGTFENKPVVRFRVEPDSLLRLMVDPLEVSYDPAGKRLVEYRGISNVHDPRTHKTYNVRIAYYSTPPADAPPLPHGD